MVRSSIGERTTGRAKSRRAAGPPKGGRLVDAPVIDNPRSDMIGARGRFFWWGDQQQATRGFRSLCFQLLERWPVTLRFYYVIIGIRCLQDYAARRRAQTGRIRTLAGISKRSCNRRIIASESARLRCITSYTRVRLPITRTSARWSESLPIEPEANPLDRVGRVDGKMFLLAGFDERREHVQPVTFRSSLTGRPTGARSPLGCARSRPWCESV